MRAIDSHIHVWTEGDGQSIWIRNNIAALQRDFSLDDYRLADHDGPLATEGVYAVQATLTAAETDALLRLASNDPMIAGVIGWTDLEADPGEISQSIAAFRETGPFVAVRAHPKREFDVDWLAEPKVQAGLAHLAGQGVPVDMIVNCPQINALRQALTPVEGLTPVLDHAARPFVMTGEMRDWSRDMRALARDTHLVCKVSGLAERAGVEWQQPTLHPWVAELVDIFGPDRLIYGSNWPVMTLMATLPRWQSAVLGICEDLGLSTEDQDKIFYRTARRVYEDWWASSGSEAK